MHAKHVSVPARLRARDEHLQPQPRDVLRLVVGRSGGLRRRREGREERGREDDDNEDRALGDGVAHEGRTRREARAQARSPPEQVQRADGEGGHEHRDLHREGDPVRGLVEIFDEHEAAQRLEDPRRHEEGDGDQRGEREPPDRPAQAPRRLRSLDACAEQDAPQQRDDAPAPHRDGHDVDEVEEHVLRVAVCRRVRDEQQACRVRHHAADDERALAHVVAHPAAAAACTRTA